MRQLLYTLKHDYGHPLAVYQRTVDSVNLATGTQSIVEVPYRVQRAVVLPVSAFLKLFRLRGEGPIFRYGGDLSLKRRIFIIERRDLPGVTMTNEFSYILYDHDRYNVTTLDDFPESEAYYVIGEEVTGIDVNEQYNLSIQDWVYLVDSAGQMWTASASDSISVTDVVGGIDAGP